jgi:hypothetical protein
VLFPLALAKRLVENLFPNQMATSDVYPVPPWQNDLFTACLETEAGWLAQGKTLPFGLTVMAIARKK